MNKVAKQLKNLVKAASTIITVEQAYQFGKDCGINGSNVINSHYAIFATKENTQAWERGKKDGEKNSELDDLLDSFVHE